MTVAVAAAESYETAGALMREIYAEALAEITVDNTEITRLSQFNTIQQAPGLKYVQPILARRPDGFSHVIFGEGPVELNKARAGKVERAEVQTNSIYLTDVVDKDMIDATEQKGTGKYGKTAVKAIMSVITPAMVEAGKIEWECVAMYGRSPRAFTGQKAGGGFNTAGLLPGVAIAQNTIGIIGATSLWAADFVGCTYMVIDKAEFAPGLWATMEGEEVSFFLEAPDGTPHGVAGADTYVGSATLGSVDIDNGVLIFTTPVPALNALVLASFDGAGDQASDRRGVAIWRASTRGQTTGGDKKESVGLFPILQNTGTIFNVSAKKYTVWGATQLNNAAAAFTIETALRVSSKVKPKGTGSGAMWYVPTDTWTKLAIDQIANLRWMDGFSGEKSVGWDAVKFIGATGLMGVKPHAMLKKGYAMLLDIRAAAKTPGGSIKTLGTNEWQFDSTGGDSLHYVPGMSGYELRMKCNKGIFVVPPGRQALVSNIVDSF